MVPPPPAATPVPLTQDFHLTHSWHSYASTTALVAKEIAWAPASAPALEQPAPLQDTKQPTPLPPMQLAPAPVVLAPTPTPAPRASQMLT